MTQRLRARPLRGLLCGVALLVLVAGVLFGIEVVPGGRAAAGTSGGPYGVYVSTFSSEREMTLGNLGGGSSTVISGLAVTDIGINSTATTGVATTYTDYSGGGAVTIFAVPSNHITGTIPGLVPVGYAMDPVDPNIAFAVTGFGEVDAINLSSATYKTITNLNPTGASFTAMSIGVTPDGSTVLVGGISNSFGFIDAVSTSTGGATVWQGGMRDYQVLDLAVAPDGTALFATISSTIGSGPHIFRLPIPFNPKTPVAWAAPSATTTLDITFPAALTVGRHTQNVYLVGLNPNGASLLQAFSAATGANSGEVGLPFNSSSNGNGGFNGGVKSVALSPDGQTLLAVGGSYNVAAGFAQVNTVICPIATAGVVLGKAAVVEANSDPIGPRDVVVTPDQAPVAGLAAASGTAGSPVTFDASSSTVTYGSITNFAWNFGDGSPVVNSGGPTVTHTYASQGTYTVTVTETDSAGVSVPPAPYVPTAVNGPGTSPYLNSSPSASTSEQVPVSKQGTPPPPPPKTTSTTVKSTTTTVPGTPVIKLVPTVGPPGTIVSVSGHGFPANRSVKVTWSTNNGSFTETTDSHGNLPAHPFYILTPDVLGPRMAIATTSGVPPAKADFLTVARSGEPGGSTDNPAFFRSEGP
ncbi:MAG TPA: PKD domain-containing protein [Acidimicrobiales bacterium]|nr:PKD domain-containing protein [Acidimicrobiales bacterium]